VAHITFDEAHRATGNYAYVYIAKKYVEQCRSPLVLGITASPGSTPEKIAEVKSNLFIERVEVKTENDPDVAPYIFDKDVEWVKVAVPDKANEIRILLEAILDDRLKKLHGMGVIYSKSINLNKKELLMLQQRLQAEITRAGRPELYKAVSVLAEIMKVGHAVDLIQTQGVQPLQRYFDRLREEAGAKGGSKATRRLMEDPRIKHAMRVVADSDEVNPKTEKVKEIVSAQLADNPASKIIVFTNFRDTADIVAKALAEVGGARPVRFVGQASKLNDKGLSQKKQVEILEMFRAGEYNVLIATSVAEEGLDIPSTDLVLFYEPVPSEIRSIQRRGRTGRNTVGRVVVLMSKGTRDEGTYMVSQRKEKRMYKTMQHMKDGQAMADVLDGQPQPTASEEPAEDGEGAVTGGSDFTQLEPAEDGPQAEPPEPGPAASPQPASVATQQATVWPQPTVAMAPQPASVATQQAAVAPQPAAGQASLETFEPKKERKDEVEVYVDSREMRSGVAKALEAKGVRLDFRALEVGDYVLSDRVCVERKTAEDFLNTLFDPGRGLFEQITSMKREFLRPVLVIEGEGLYTKRRISPAAIHGIIASITVDFGIPVLFTANEEETASYVYAIARREQVERRRSVNPHAQKSSQTLSERQEYLVSAISEVGPVIAKNLLRHFGSVKKIAEASTEDLMQVEKVGPRTAARIREIMDSQYKPRE
jgi:Fanconi anemia group M protein